MNCDPDHPADVRADLLLALLRRGVRTYSELRNAGFDAEGLRPAADAIESSGRGRVAIGPWVEWVAAK
jgi:hypothetical protein